MLIRLYPATHATRGIITVVRDGAILASVPAAEIGTTRPQSHDVWAIHSADEDPIRKTLTARGFDVRSMG